MRHFLASGTVATLPRGVGATTARTGLVTSTGLALGTATRLPCTAARAVTLAAVAEAADEHRDVAARAGKASSG